MKYKSLLILLFCSIGVVGQTTNPTSTWFTNGLMVPSKTTAPMVKSGSIWHDLSSNTMKWYNGTQWVTVGSSGGVMSEVDPTVTTTLRNNWNTAFSWGNHASAGYTTSTTFNSRIIFNSATVGLSKATLNSTYPSVPVGTMVLCPSIALGGAVYIKATENGSSDVWQICSAPPVM